MMETPTWVMNAIAPSSAMAGERPRPQDTSRSPIVARVAVTWPCSQMDRPVAAGHGPGRGLPERIADVDALEAAKVAVAGVDDADAVLPHQGRHMGVGDVVAAGPIAGG